LPQAAVPSVPLSAGPINVSGPDQDRRLWNVQHMPNASQIEQVVLVDENDQPVGVAEKLRAHQRGGSLHRAFSIFIFNAAGELLLQRRAKSKYHFGGLWTNTCCGHPRPGETIEQAAVRRLQEEMGFKAPLRRAFTFIYKAHDEPSGLTEQEFDHVLSGSYAGEPAPDPAEVEDWRWLSLEKLRDEIGRNPQDYTPWFRIALTKGEELNVFPS
jgi:isopentenyl-diphosphate delta-isomerase